MPDLEFVLPGDLNTLTGGYLYDRHIVAGLRGLGWAVRMQLLPEGFPCPDRAALGAADALFGALPDGALAVVDGLALGVLPDQVQAHGPRLRLVGLVHHPLALETGLEPGLADRLRDSERRSLAGVRRVVVTSRATLNALADYGVAADRIGVVEPGTPARPPALGSDDGVPTLLCVAAVVARKGHDVLLAALAKLRHRSWRLRCVGALDRSPATYAALLEQAAGGGLSERVTWAGEVAPQKLSIWYRRADVFVFPTRYEGYGMALAEALAYGLPIVSTTAGAVPDTVPDGAGLLVPPDDPDALAEALDRVLTDAGLRRALGAASRCAGLELPTWTSAAQSFAVQLQHAAIAV